MGTRVVKNYPSPRLMETIGATNQKAPEAIGELVANCFDARYDDEKLDITIDMRNQKIIVIDNGKGMTSEILEKAVCIAEDMSRHIEKGEDTKGHFGMGFKTSCATLGNFYEIFTRPISGDKEYHVAFDIKEYGSRPSGSDAWDVTIEDFKPSPTSPLGNIKHGTAFVISSLKDDKITPSSILEYMGEAFKGHLENGDRITMIDDSGVHEARPKKYDFIKGTKVKIDVKFGPGDKYHITGWVAIDKKVHNDGFYGFNIYRHHQLVMEHDKTWLGSPHLMKSRIIGEVNMDFLDATFYKKGIQQSLTWKMAEVYMNPFLAGIVRASKSISEKKNVRNPIELKKIISKIHDEYNALDEIDTSNDDSENESKKPSNDQTKIEENIKNFVTENSLKLEDEGEISITFLEKETSENTNIPFDYIFSEEDDNNKAELQVILYMSHPLWTKRIDSDVRRILATSDSIYRMLVEKLEFDTVEARRIRDAWVNKNTEGMK